MAQVAIKNLKYSKLPEGTELTIRDIVANESDGRVEDCMICHNADGQLVRVPVREYMKMKEANGKDLFAGEEGDDEIQMPNSFVIVSSEDREDRDGNKVYPIFAYRAADDFFHSQGAMEYKELVAQGLKDDNEFEPVQNYTIQVR